MLSSLAVYACLGYVVLLFGCHLYDCWHLSIAKVAAASVKAIAPAVESDPPLLLLPPAPMATFSDFSDPVKATPKTPKFEAIELPPVAVEDAPHAEQDAPIDYQGMTSQQLRKLCGDRGIRWRNLHGKNCHASKPEMIALLGV